MPKRKKKLRGRLGLDRSDGSPRAETPSVPPSADDLQQDRSESADGRPPRQS
ncbi:hypothetical protein ACFCXT_35075 [Streptomyces vinaceus]|uniref:hypothetical protein n=1 Tax=Streptomyces vinaceus TaxID=1960 RepID=UPI0035D65786